MKKYYLLITSLLLSLYSYDSKAQYDDFDPGKIIAGAQADINYLAGGYLKPFGNALGIGLNNGWYQTAKPHKLGRFDLMITPSFVFVPSSDRNFTINNADLTQLELVNGTSAEAPTVFGTNSAGPTLRFKDDQTTTFNTPNGSGIGFLPLPMAQLGVGLIKNTDLIIRYVPTVDIGDDGEVGMFGFGIKHDILQWIPGDKVIPFDASVFFGYTSVNVNMDLDDGSGNDDQEAVIKSKGYTFRALVSKKLLFFTPYVGLGYNSAKTDINVNGTYSYETQTAPGLPPVTTSIKDPVALTADDASGFVGNLGFRLKFLWVMAFSADYTFGAYSSATAGLGFSVDF